MLSKDKIIKALDFYWSFNYNPHSDSAQVFVSDYDDAFFRWESDYFKHDKVLTVIVDRNRIVIINTLEVQDRLRANMGVISISPDKKKFACRFDVIRDLVIGGIKIDAFNEIDEGLIKRMERSQNEGMKTIIEKDKSARKNDKRTIPRD